MTRLETGIRKYFLNKKRSCRLIKGQITTIKIGNLTKARRYLFRMLVAYLES